MSGHPSQHQRKMPVVWLALFALAIAARPGYSCQVPVFRYALERWATDRYQVVVLHQGELKGPHQEAIGKLKEAADQQAGKAPLIDLKVVDVTKSKNPRYTRMLSTNLDSSKPMMLAFYPSANKVGRDAPAYKGDLSVPNVKRLLGSPIRQDIAKRLGSGDSAVWIFVPCGDEKKDRAAYERLEKQIALDAKWIELPSAEELEVKPEVLEQTKVPLRIGFSIKTLQRDDEDEQFLLQTLLHSEEDLTSFEQPLAFPVFGQGRVLYCLVGQGIAEDTIRSASSFMAGPCSCQVKNQNPGFDLLLQANWKKVLGEVLISEPIETPDREALAPTLLTIPPGRKKK